MYDCSPNKSEPTGTSLVDLWFSKAQTPLAPSICLRLAMQNDLGEQRWQGPIKAYHKLNASSAFKAMPRKAANMSSTRAFVAVANAIAPEKKPTTGNTKPPTAMAAKDWTTNAIKRHATAMRKLKQHPFAAT